MIIVAHGTPEGLQDSSKKTMEWESVNKLIKNENSKLTFMASCYGQNALDEMDNAYGFSAEIDNQVAAFVASAYIYKALGEDINYRRSFNLAIERYIYTIKSPDSANFLAVWIGGGGGGSGGSEHSYIFMKMSLAELIAGSATVLCFIASLLISKPSLKNYNDELAINLTKYLRVSILINVVSFLFSLFGKLNNTASLVNLLTSFISAFISTITIFAKTLSWLVKAATLAQMATTITAPPATLILILKIVSFLLSYYSLWCVSGSNWGEWRQKRSKYLK